MTGLVAPAGAGVPAGVTGFGVATAVANMGGAGVSAGAGIVCMGVGVVIAVAATVSGGGGTPTVVVLVVVATEVAAILVAVAAITPVVARAVTITVGVVTAVGAVVGTAWVGIGVTRGACVSTGACVTRDIGVGKGVDGSLDASDASDASAVAVITSGALVRINCGGGEDVAIAVGVAATMAVAVSRRYAAIAVEVSRASGTSELKTTGSAVEVTVAPVLAVTSASGWPVPRDRKMTSAPMMITSAPPTPPMIARGLMRSWGRDNGMYTGRGSATTRCRTGMFSDCVPSICPDPEGGALYPVLAP